MEEITFIERFKILWEIDPFRTIMGIMFIVALVIVAICLFMISIFDHCRRNDPSYPTDYEHLKDC